MKDFQESDRYDYPLTPDSFVIDAGGYEGNWAAEINHKYRAHVLVFEPVQRPAREVAGGTPGKLEPLLPGRRLRLQRQAPRQSARHRNQPHADYELLLDHREDGPPDGALHLWNRPNRQPLPRVHRGGRKLLHHPRLFIQRETKSDLTDQTVNYEGSMTDCRHEDMMLDGVIEVRRDELILRGKLQRRELAAPADMNGEEVIVDGQLYRIIRLELPEHPASWYRGEPVTYVLKKA
jgi:hypothetical protein